MKNQQTFIKIWAIGVVVVAISMILGTLYLLRVFNAVTLRTQVIEPKPGIECVVVSAADSTSVDCWRAID